MKILNGKIFQWRNILLERHFEGSDKAKIEELSWQCVTAPNYLVTETFYHLTKSCSYIQYYTARAEPVFFDIFYSASLCRIMN